MARDEELWNEVKGGQSFKRGQALGLRRGLHNFQARGILIQNQPPKACRFPKEASKNSVDFPKKPPKHPVDFQLLIAKKVPRGLC